MKTLFYALLLLTFIGCKKEEMEVVPEYSFVRLNEEGAEISPCYTQIAECLPASDLTDIDFQIITDFQEAVGGGTAVFHSLVAFPCDVCADKSAQEVFDMIFGEERIDVPFVNNEAGFVSFIVNGKYATPPQVGDYVYIAGDTSGNYNGYHLIESITPDVSLEILITTTPYVGLTTGSPYAGIINQSFILAEYVTQLEDDSEFAGDNYLWNFNIHMLNSIGLAEGQCFRMCVWDIQYDLDVASPPDFISGDCLGTTNCFSVVSDICYTTKLVYGCDENAFGFYTDGTNPFVMSIRLPMWLFHPRYPSEEKGYQLSSGQFVKLAERIDKTWELETDYMPEQYHERLRIALGCDNIEVSNENAQLTDVAIYRKDEYSIEWSDEVKNFPFAKATTTVFKQLLTRSTNSNCV